MNKIRIGLVISFVVLTSLISMAEEPLRIGIWPGSEIFQPIIAKVYKQLKVPVQFVHLPTERVLLEVSSGYLDADIARSELVLGMYPNIISSNQSFTPFSLVGYVGNRSEPVVVQKNEDLAKYQVGLVIGTKIAEELVKKHGVKATKVKSVEQLVTLMANGRIDIAMIVTIQNTSLLEKSGLRRLPLHFIDTRMVHILNKKHMALRDRFDQEVKRLKKTDPQFQSMLKQVTPK